MLNYHDSVGLFDYLTSVLQLKYHHTYEHVYTMLSRQVMSTYVEGLTLTLFKS